MPDRRASLRGKIKESGYYVELDQEIYDVMLERYEEINHLAERRSQVFSAFRKELNSLVQGLNLYRAVGHRFIFIGGEALSAQLALHHDKSHFLRGNFPIRDDVDVLMRKGSIHTFLQSITHVNNFPVIHPKVNSMSFTFPCQSGTCRFDVYKVKLNSHWGGFMPTLDISFPQSEVEPTLADSQSVLIESLSRALEFKEDKQKYLDRTLFLHNLLPDHLGAEFLYQREFHLKPLIRDKQRLLEKASLSEIQRKELEAKIEAQQQEIGARFQEIADLKTASKEELEQVRRELSMEMNSQLEARMEELIIKSKKQVEDYSAKLLSLQGKVTALNRDLEIKSGVTVMLSGEIEHRDSELQRVEAELKTTRLRQVELEGLLKEAQLTVSSEAQDQSEKIKTLESQKTELEENLDLLKATGRKIKARVSQLKSEAETVKQKYDQLQEKLEPLNTEIKQQRKKYSIANKKFEESRSRITLLEAELAEVREQQEHLKAQEAEYENNRKEVSIKHENERIAQLQHENEHLREEVRWYRDGRNLQVAIGMVPAALVIMREFLVPRFHDAAKATCSRFKQKIIYQYCVRNWITEDAYLWALEAFDQLPVYTRIVRFAEPEYFEPGYDLALQAKINIFDLTNFLFKGKQMELLLPEGFTALSNLYITEMDQSLDAFFAALVNSDSPEQVKNFATANIMLCGIMPDKKQQNACARALATAMALTNRWPCNMHNFISPQDNLCKRLMMPGFTRKLTRKKQLALLPSWKIKPDGEFKWYDIWPVQLNKHQLSKELPGGSCSRVMGLSKYCGSENMRIWQFNDNHWSLNGHSCNDVSAASIGTSKAFWLQSWTGDINDVLACDGEKFMEAVWQP